MRRVCIPEYPLGCVCVFVLVFAYTGIRLFLVFVLEIIMRNLKQSKKNAQKKIFLKIIYIYIYIYNHFISIKIVYVSFIFVTAARSTLTVKKTSIF